MPAYSGDIAQMLAVTLGTAAACFFLLWLLSLALRDVSIIDLYWGPGFVVLAAVGLILEGQAPASTLVLVGMLTLWAFRLGIHLLHRKLSEPHEDVRYSVMRKAGGPGFAVRSLWTIFALQAVLQWLVATPVSLAIADPGPFLPVLFAIGCVVFVAGLTIETIGDWQLTRFKRMRVGPDAVLDTGVWAWSRHPNYFGEATLWWGLFCAALGTGAPWYTVLSPIVMTVLLLRVSGVTMLEHGLKKRKPAYADYVRRTSVFIPWPPARK